jgi:hypothetical protein
MAEHDISASRVHGAAAGVLAALAALSVAELVAGTRRDLQSPVLDVGDRVVDAVPRPIKDLAIDWFGTNDKAALLVGIAVLLAAYAVAVGVAALGRRWRWAIAGVAAFGVVGASASQTTRRATEWYAVLPSLLGGVAGALVLLGLRRALLGSTADDRSEPVGAFDRRRFVAAAAATATGAAATAALGRRLAQRYDVGSQRSTLALPRSRDPLPPAPAGVQAPAHRVSPFFTPNRDFYRIDTALTVPRCRLTAGRSPSAGWSGDRSRCRTPICSIARSSRPTSR